jgi:predicted flavoprotein YhiN
MSNSNPSERELLKTVLEPLLEDFIYWFSRARTLLESERISFLSVEEQEALLARVKQTQQEVSAARMLFNATDGQAGIDTATLVPWHQLVAQCWQVAMRWRSLKREKEQDGDRSSNFDPQA